VTIFLKGVLSFCAAVALISVQAVPGPAARARHHLVYNAAAQLMLTLNGAQIAGNAGRDTALWAWNGSTWRRLPGNPPTRVNEAVAFDPDRGRLVVHGGSSIEPGGGELDDTWEFDGEVWHRVGAAGPGARAHHAMAYDEARQQMILFGTATMRPPTTRGGGMAKRGRCCRVKDHPAAECMRWPTTRSVKW